MNSNSNSDIRVIKRLKIVNYLHENGIDYDYSRVDYMNPKYKVFIYKRTDKLNQLMDKFYENENKK